MSFKNKPNLFGKTVGGVPFETHTSTVDTTTVNTQDGSTQKVEHDNCTVQNTATLMDDIVPLKTNYNNLQDNGLQLIRHSAG